MVGCIHSAYLCWGYGIPSAIIWTGLQLLTQRNQLFHVLNFHLKKYQSAFKTGKIIKLI